MHTRIPLVILLSLTLAVPGLAEEGMWTFDNPPVKALQEKYNFTPTQEWLDHVRLSSVRFMDGGSGSFASPYGLLVTNHHVAVGQLQKMSSRQADYVKNGFYAKRPEDEIKCPDLEVNVLVSMKNITKHVLAAIKPEMSDAEAIKARKAERARIEKESQDKTGLRSDVVKLYHGGEYWLYRYQKYTDVRLVMAPERQAAIFGGDSDNFTYPRYGLDITFFRVYANGQPLKTEHYLKWNASGAGNGELVFITGHPGRTNRLYTAAQLELQRDLRYPLTIKYIDRILAGLHEYSRRGKEQVRRARAYFYRYNNAHKAFTGMYKSLTDAGFMQRKQKTEAEIRKLVDDKPEWKQQYGQAWENIEKVISKHKSEIGRRAHQRLFGSELGKLAVNIVKYVQEIKKPDADRLDGFHDSELEELKFHLFSPAPVYRDLEAAILESSFRLTIDTLGNKDKLSKIILTLGDPKEAAEKLTAETKLLDVAERKKLIEGGLKAVEKSKDPLIVFARRIVPIIVENEEWQKQHIDSVITPASEQIAQARFAIYGNNTYPDATFTLRMAYGPVKGYPMNGTRAPYMTTIYGLYNRALGFDRQGEWSLPERFWKHKKLLNLSTPVNFVCECDIIGGNSGSPVINQKAELVGIVFDGNIESLAGRFFFDPENNRAVSVHSAYVLEALQKLYDAQDLADELEIEP
jgi:hypothetical protein